MRYYGKNSLASILNIILTCILVLGVILTAFVYIFEFKDVNVIGINKVILFVLLTIGVIATFVFIIELKKIIKTLVLENPFTWDNVKSLRKLMFCCFAITGCYLVNLLVNLGKNSFSIISIDSVGIHTDAEIFIFLFAGCFIGVLSKVFEQAVRYKEDNDLTI